LIHNGKIYESVMKRANLTHHELNSALRDAGCTCATEVHMAVLENTGAISIVPRTSHANASMGSAAK
jgi:uncharacterized membrane protein YcaP (DUF421 family)